MIEEAALLSTCAHHSETIYCIMFTVTNGVAGHNVQETGPQGHHSTCTLCSVQERELIRSPDGACHVVKRQAFGRLNRIRCQDIVVSVESNSSQNTRLGRASIQCRQH
jgi:hypothetical protein